jgi:hypothetical protein
VEAEPSRGVRARKRKWTNDLDALLLREAKLHKPHEQRHGAIGTTYESIASSLNDSGRLPWRTDKKHLQGRVQHLVEARWADQRVTARATGIEEEHGKLEVLLDYVIGEADFFKSTEVNRREVRREKDTALVKGGRLARTQAMVRQAAAIAMKSDDDGDDGGVEPGSENAGPELQVGRARRRPQLVSLDVGSSSTADGVERHAMQILQSNASAMSSQAIRQDEADGHKQRLDEGRELRLRDIDNRRVDWKKNRRPCCSALRRYKQKWRSCESLHRKHRQN